MKVSGELQHYLVSLLARIFSFSTIFMILIDNVEVILNGIDKSHPSKLYHVMPHNLTFNN